MFSPQEFINQNKGEFSLQVNANDEVFPVNTRTEQTIDINTFEVIIRDAQGNLYQHYEEFGSMPSSIRMEEGSYSI